MARKIGILVGSIIGAALCWWLLGPLWIMGVLFIGLPIWLIRWSLRQPYI